MSDSGRIRAVAIGLVSDAGNILVSETTEPSTGTVFSRPPGGGIEFGESSRDALDREFQEELGATITSASLLQVIESRFAFSGQSAHEIVFVYAVEVADLAALRVHDRALDAKEGVTLSWRSPHDFDGSSRILLPAGLRYLHDLDRVGDDSTSASWTEAATATGSVDTVEPKPFR
ncbi:NUDIX hydrolase [Humidisolicoccus flavus]|uniref:NUDIX hydrolase n=1 Tax=Humidisolicoccus flavus TaxID=3111414 RepID=UPI00324E4EF7